MLRGQYLEAVDRLDEMGEDDSTTSESTAGFLGEHLVTMAGRGLVAWSDDDGLLRRFFENAEPEGARRPIWLIGRYLSDEENEISGEAVRRFQRLADELLGLLEKAGRERMGHLSRLGWWFASGRFDPEWTLDRLTRLLKLAGAAKPSFAVMDSLAEMSKNYPAKAFEVLSLLVKTSTDGPGGSVLAGRSEPARAILGAALAHPPTEDGARLFIHQLGAAGHESFRDLQEG